MAAGLCGPCFVALAAGLPLPVRDEPTAFTPGTWQKLAVLAARHERGERLFHPADNCPNPD
jgi:hypothetical protein